MCFKFSIEQLKLWLKKFAGSYLVLTGALPFGSFTRHAMKAQVPQGGFEPATSWAAGTSDLRSRLPRPPLAKTLYI